MGNPTQATHPQSSEDSVHVRASEDVDEIPGWLLILGTTSHVCRAQYQVDTCDTRDDYNAIIDNCLILGRMKVNDDRCKPIWSESKPLESCLACIYKGLMNGQSCYRTRWFWTADCNSERCEWDWTALSWFFFNCAGLFVLWKIWNFYKYSRFCNPPTRDRPLQL